MTLTDIVLDLDHSRNLKEVLDAAGMKMETAFSWHHIKTMCEDRWVVASAKSDYPAPVLEELLAFIVERFGMVLQVVKSPLEQWYVSHGTNFVNGKLQFNNDPKIAAAELIERMVSQC